MVRVKGGIAAHARHKKVRVHNKGYRGKNRTTFVMGKQAMMKAGQHAYIDRKKKKRDFRQLWIARISSVLRTMGTNYSKMKNQWLHAKMEVDRKSLSELAVNYPKVFEKIVEVGKNAKRVA